MLKWYLLIRLDTKNGKNWYLGINNKHKITNMDELLKKSLLKQKEDKDRILARSYIDREENKNAEKYINNNLVKIIVGPRRCGKSTFAFLLLKERNIKFAYANLEDENLIKGIAGNNDDLTEALQAIYGDVEYIIFDEIQNLDMWEKYLNRLQIRDYKVIATGSSAKMLSSEIATALTGRRVVIELLPFSFKESLNYKYKPEEIDLLDKAKELREYMEKGGFPETYKEDVSTYQYLNNLLPATITNDVFFRYGAKIRNISKIKVLADILINNCCHEISYRRITSILKMKSHKTIEKYTEYLLGTFLFYSLSKYSHKHSERVSSGKKIYLVDNGFLSSRNLSSSGDLGVYFENLIFIELLRRRNNEDYDLFYYKTRNSKEVDFYLKNFNAKNSKLIQVCYSVIDPKTEQRETSALLEASQELKCDDLTIINWDIEKTEVKNGKTIKYIPAWKWLLNQ